MSLYHIYCKPTHWCGKLYELALAGLFPVHTVRSWCVSRPQSLSTVGQQRWLCLRRREERTTRGRKVWQAMQPDWGSEDDVWNIHGANWCVRVRQQAHVVWAVSIPSTVSVYKCALCLSVPFNTVLVLVLLPSCSVCAGHRQDITTLRINSIELKPTLAWWESCLSMTVSVASLFYA